MRERARGALGAIAFLTVVPVGRLIELGAADLRRGVVFFPLVGAGVGAVVAGVAWAAAGVLPPAAAAALAVATGVGATAAFHLDGLGDVSDGIGASLGGRDPMPAMGDPRLGAFGVAAVALDLLLKVSLVAFASAASGFAWAVVAAAALARLGPIVLAWRCPYVGAGTGAWTRDVRRRTVFGAVVVAAAVAVPSIGPVRAAAGLATVGVVDLVLGAWARRRLGGVTGDVFGASAEVGETLSLAVMLAAV